MNKILKLTENNSKSFSFPLPLALAVLKKTSIFPPIIFLFLSIFNLIRIGRNQTIMSDLDKWIEIVKECKYLPENDLKQLCDIVCDYLIEESNVHPVQLPGKIPYLTS